MNQYRKKPLVVLAEQTEIPIQLDTRQGVLTALPGDWIVTGVDGRRYPVSDEVFRATYERVEGDWHEPSVGWKEGMQRLARGRCAFCGHPMQNVDVSGIDGLRWACLEGCNP